MAIHLPHLSPRKITSLYPLALLAASVSIVWLAQRNHRMFEQYATLQHTLTDYFHLAKNDAQDAFDAGDFQRAAALLDPTLSTTKSDTSTLLLRARALECLGYFREAADAYTALEKMPGKHLTILRGKNFCARMATERMPGRTPSREVLYRLHDELMHRGDPASARFVARKLLPDPQPLRESLLALLHALDSNSQLTVNEDTGLVDVIITQWQPRMLDLLRDVQIGRLNLAQCALQDIRELSGLQVRSLVLSNSRGSDLSSLRTMPLHQLWLDHSSTADLRPLAGLPLRELNLSHTMVSSAQPLALCPLQKLDLSHTAIRGLEPLRGMELRELDLSHTHVTDLSPLAGMPLERLALDGTAIHNLHGLAGAKLKSLSLVSTAVKDLDALADMPLTELDLRGCELLTDIQALSPCPQLEHVYLPRHLKIPSDHWQLPHLKFIEYERRGETSIAQK